MILTEEQAKDRLGSERNLVNRFGKVEKETSNVVEIIPLKRPGDGGPHHDPNPNGVEITARARLGERQEDLAQEFGITQQTVSNYKVGSIGKLDQNLIQSKMDEIQDVAMCKLLKSLGFLNDEKLSKMSGKDLSAVAANMAKVAGSVRPQVTDNNNVHLHLYAPELRKESSFKTIEVHG